MTAGLTMAEKILARAAGRERARAGEEVLARPDFVLAYVFAGFANFPKVLSDLGVEALDDPTRFALFLDHNIPVTDARLEARMPAIRRWCAAQGVAAHPGAGIGHVAAGELGYAPPGGFVVHFDGHVSQLGAFGCLGVGVHIGLYEAFARPAIAITVPETVRVRLTGRLAPGVAARDLMSHLIWRWGADFCNRRVLEFAGDGLDALTPDALQTLTGLAMFTGALTAIVEPRPHTRPRANRRPDIPTARSDEDALFAGDFTCDLSEVEPMVAEPPSPACVRPLAEIVGRPLQVGYLGSCVSGRAEELEAAARILRGRRVHPDFTLNIVPSSRAIMAAAAASGALGALLEAGAFVSSPTCSYCYGAVGALAAGQAAISSGTLNNPGRMGSRDAEIYLASALAVASAALEGVVVDPRRTASPC